MNTVLENYSKNPNEILPMQLSHAFLANSAPIIASNALGNITHADPILSHVSCKIGIPADVASIGNNGDLKFGTPAHMYIVRPNPCNSLSLTSVIENGNVKVAKTLIERGVDTYIPGQEGLLPLHLAARSGRLDMLNLLLDHDNNASINYNHNINGVWAASALHMAVANQKFEIINELLKRNANSYLLDHHGFLPLHIATRYGHLDTLNLLLDYDKNASIDYQKADGWSPLHLAVGNGQVQIVESLLKRDAHPHLANQNGFLPLHIAAQEGRMDMLNLLLNHDNNASVNYQKTDGWSPLHLAVGNGQAEIAKELLKRNANPYLINEDGLMPLHLAAKEGLLDMLNILLDNDKNASIDFQKSDQWSALHLAISHGRIQIVEELLKRGANLNISNNFQMTPLHHAIQNNHLEVIKVLLEKGANPNAQDMWNLTPLHYAIRSNNVEIVKLLLEKGAYPHIQNEWGLTPQQDAVNSGHHDMIILLEKGAKNILDKKTHPIIEDKVIHDSTSILFKTLEISSESHQHSVKQNEVKDSVVTPKGKGKEKENKKTEKIVAENDIQPSITSSVPPSRK